MAEYVCDSCGKRNPAGTDFCEVCGAFLAWDEVVERDGVIQREAPGGTRTEFAPPEDKAVVTSTPLRGSGPATTEPANGRFRVRAETNEVETPPGGEPAVLTLQLANTSDIVDGYLVEPVGAPPWLAVEPDHIRLLPGTEQPLQVRLKAVSATLVPAQRVEVVLRVRALDVSPAPVDVPVLVIVPVVDAPVQLRAEPHLLRVRDRAVAGCTVIVDNANSNRTVQLRFSGADPELAVRFRFEPLVLEVGPGATASAHALFAAPEPEPGQEVSRVLTLTAFDGTRSAEAVVTLQQATSEQVEDPPVTLEVVPSLLRVQDTIGGTVRVVVDNRGGSQEANLRFRASDPEQVVRVDWVPEQLVVPAGGTAQAEARLRAPLPAAGSEVSRAVTLSAEDGRRTATATATFVQVASASPIETLTMELEPAVVRVRDATGAHLLVILDNRRGRSALRVGLQGSDPERAVRFTFAPQVVEVGAGQLQQVSLQLEAPGPEPGQEWTRQLVITATDGLRKVQASGSWVQSSSRAAIEQLAVRLDPSVVRLSNRSRGSLVAVVDNRGGARPVRVSMSGDDPENIVRFGFAPPVLEIPAGHVGRTAVTIAAPGAPAGGEVTRPFTIAASDGRTEVNTDGQLIQSAADLRPLFRLLLTLLGALGIVYATFLPWLADQSERGVDFNVDFAEDEFDVEILPWAAGEDLLSIGLVTLGLAVLVVLGLTGRSGRLTRAAAILAALVVVGLVIGAGVFSFGAGLGSGTIVMLLSCVVAYLGGALARR